MKIGCVPYPFRKTLLEKTMTNEDGVKTTPESWAESGKFCL
jgi:hypothetical protein